MPLGCAHVDADSNSTLYYLEDAVPKLTSTLQLSFAYWEPPEGAVAIDLV